MKKRVAIAITCPDPFNRKATLEALEAELQADFVYEITLAAPDKTLAEGRDEISILSAQAQVRKILKVIAEHPDQQFTNIVAVVGHTDCGGAPHADVLQHHRYISAAVETAKSWNLAFRNSQPVVVVGALQHKHERRVDLIVPGGRFSPITEPSLLTPALA